MRTLTRAFAFTLGLAFIAPAAHAQSGGTGETAPASGSEGSTPPAATSSAAAAPDPARVEEAREQYRAGVAAFRSRRFGDAVVAFERSYRARQHPTTLYNVAEARLRAGDRERAVQELREVLAMTDPAPDAATVERARVLAREAGVEDLQPMEHREVTCPTCPTCAAAAECPVCPPSRTLAPPMMPIALGVGGFLVLGVGMSFMAWAWADAAAYRNPDVSAQHQEDLANEGNAFRWVGLAGIVIGVAAEVASVYLLTHPRSSEPAHARRSRFMPTARVDVAPNGLMLSGTF